MGGGPAVLYRVVRENLSSNRSVAGEKSEVMKLERKKRHKTLSHNRTMNFTMAEKGSHLRKEVTSSNKF